MVDETKPAATSTPETPKTPDSQPQQSPPPVSTPNAASNTPNTPDAASNTPNTPDSENINTPEAAPDAPTPAEMLSTMEEIFNSSGGEALPKSTQAKIEEMRTQINEGSLSPENKKALETFFKISQFGTETLKKIQSIGEILEEDIDLLDLFENHGQASEQLKNTTDGKATEVFQKELNEIKREIGELFVKKFEENGEIAEKSPEEILEQSEKIFDLKMILMAGGGEAFKWFTEGMKNSSLERLIDAMLLGADYNSAGALNRAYESASDNEKISSTKFFEAFRENPKQTLEKISQTDLTKNLDQELNWGQGKEILDQAQGKDEEVIKQAFQTYFLQLYAHIAQGPAPDAAWAKTSRHLSKEVFDGGKIDPKVFKELEKANKDEEYAQSLFTKE